MNGLVQSILLGAVRAMAAGGAAWLVAHGYMTDSSTQGMIGSVLFLATLCFTAYDKFKVNTKIANAAVNPTNSIAVAAVETHNRMNPQATMQPIPNPGDK